MADPNQPTPQPQPNPNPTPEPAAPKPGSPPDGSKSPAQPAAAAPPKPGDSPRPAPPAGDPADQRVADAQREMHRATEEAAQQRRDTEVVKVENEQLRAKLSGLVSRQEFHPVEEPTAPGAIAPEQVAAIWEEYSKAPDDPAAFGILLTKAVELAETRVSGKQQHAEARRGNQQRVEGLTRAVYQQISDVVKEQAPDVHLDVFWSWAAPMAQRETPETLRNPIDRWEFQMRRGIELYRQRFGSQPPVPDPQADPNSNRRPATAVMPAGSLTPRGGAPNTRPLTMAEQTAKLQERIMPGAARRAG